MRVSPLFPALAVVASLWSGVAFAGDDPVFTLVVDRERAWAGAAAKQNIYIHAKYIGGVSNGSTASFSIPADSADGTYELKAFWPGDVFTNGTVQTFSAKPGDRVTLRTSAQMGLVSTKILFRGLEVSPSSGPGKTLTETAVNQNAKASLKFDYITKDADLYVHFNNMYIGKIDKGTSRTFSVSLLNTKNTVYVYATSWLTGTKVESDNVEIDIKPNTTCELEVRPYTPALEYGPDKSQPWIAPLRFHVWVPNHDPSFKMTMRADTDLTEMYPTPPFGDTLRESQIAQLDGVPSEEYLQSWVGTWSFPSGSKLSQKGVIALLDVLAGRKFMTLKRTRQTLYGNRYLSVGDGGLIETRTYDVRIGKNSVRFKTFDSSIIGNNKGDKRDTLLIMDQTDHRRIFVYVQTNPTSDLYKYDGAVIRSTK
jgi:hypothetical protein